MERQPSLKGDLVELRPLRPDDWTALYAVAADPEIWAMHPMRDRWREPVFREFFSDALAQQGALVALDCKTGEMIGSSRFQAYDPQDRSVEVGWTFLARSHWGTGHNREMKRLMVGHALSYVDRVDFRVGESNLRSRRALEKIGARLSPSRIERVKTDIWETVHLYYEMALDDFAREVR